MKKILSGTISIFLILILFLGSFIGTFLILRTPETNLTGSYLSKFTDNILEYETDSKY